MECPVCYRDWDSERVIPRNLPCGHSYCEEDLKSLWERPPQGTITCPTCCSEHNFGSLDEITKLVKNWAVIAYAETFARQKKEMAALTAQAKNNSGQTMLKSKNENSTRQLHFDKSETDQGSTIGGMEKSIVGSEAGLKDCSMLVLDKSNIAEQDITRNTVDQFLDEQPPTLQHNQKCLEHPQEFVVAYNKLTYHYLCMACIQGQNLQKDYYQVYPAMVNRIMERINSTRRMITYRRIQLEQAAKQIVRNAKQNREELTTRFQSHIESLRLYFEDFKKQQSEILNEALVFQEARTDDVVAEIKEQLEKLDGQSSNLNSLEYHEDSVLISMNDIIDDLYTGMMKFSPEINLEGLKIDVDIDDDAVQRIDKILTRSVELLHVNVPAFDGSDRTIQTYRDLIKNMWNCLSCGAQFGIKQVECSLCKSFRPLETYENLLHRPDKVTTEEIEGLKLRRKIEKQIILDLELNGVEEQGKSLDAAGKAAAAAASKQKEKVRDLWFMISSDWLFKWKCFVTNKISKTANQNLIQEIRQSTNSRIGILPPGPISNFTLYVQDGILMDQTIFGGGNSSNKQKGITTQQQPDIREDLVVELDYKTVKKEVWVKFTKIYGGGPSIIREKPYIYSNAIDEKTLPPIGAHPAQHRSPSPFVYARQTRSGNEVDLSGSLHFAKKKSQQITLSKKNAEKVGQSKVPGIHASSSHVDQLKSGDASPLSPRQQEPLTKNIFAKKLNNQPQKVGGVPSRMNSVVAEEPHKLQVSSEKKANKARDSKGRDSKGIDADLPNFASASQVVAERGPQARRDESDRLKKQEHIPDQRVYMKKLAFEEVDTEAMETERNEGLARRDAHTPQEKKPSLLQQAFPALLSPKIQLDQPQKEQKVQLPHKREQMIPRLRDRPNSKPLKQFQQPPRKAFAQSDDSQSDEMDTGDMNQNSQKRLATNDNKNKLLKLRLAEPFPAHDSDELEEPVSDSNKSPIMLQQPDAGKILFSPKFGGGQLESQNSVRNRDAHVEEFKSGQKTPAFTGVIGNLLTGNPKRPAKRVPKEHSQPPVHQSSGVFRFF